MSFHPDEGRALRVVQRWRENAVQRFGREPGDWDDGPVGSLAAAAVSGDVIAQAAHAYGRSRCQSGWTLPELLDDLEDLFTASNLRDAACWMVVRAATEGWSEQVIAATLAAPYRDPLTGLPTVGYLILRAEALYGARRAVPVPESHSLVLLRLRDRHGLDRTQGLLDLARQVSASFTGRCTLAALDSHGVVVLIENDASNYGRALKLADLDQIEVTLEPVPATLEGLEERLARVRYV